MRPPHMRTALLAALFIVAGTGLTPGPSTAADDDAYRNGYANRMIKQEEPMSVGDPDTPTAPPALALRSGMLTSLYRIRVHVVLVDSRLVFIATPDRVGGSRSTRCGLGR